MIQLFSDFNCPFCFVQFQRLQQIEPLPSIEYCFIEHAPDLVTQFNTQEQLNQFDQEFEVICRRSPETVFNKPTFCVNTRLAILHYYSLLEIDLVKAGKFTQLVYRGYWVHNQDISQQSVLNTYLSQLELQDLSIPKAATVAFRNNQYFWINGDMQQRIPAMRSDDSGLLLGLQHSETIVDYMADNPIQPVIGDVCQYVEQQQVALVNLPELDSMFASVHSDYVVEHFDNAISLLDDVYSRKISAVFLRINPSQESHWRELSLLKNSRLSRYLPITVVIDGESELLIKQGFLLGATDVLSLDSMGTAFLPCLASRISNYQTLTTLSDFALVDGLTGIFNKRSLLQTLQRTWRKSIRNQSLFSLVILDVDDFKPFNDIYGHLAGDQCLKQLASIFREQLHRPDDIVGRFGGEEFCFILPETNHQGIAKVLMNVQQALARAQITHKGSSIEDVSTVTLSYGVISAIAHSDASINHLVELADQALYRAKRAGKNTIVYDTFNI